MQLVASVLSYSSAKLYQGFTRPLCIEHILVRF